MYPIYASFFRLRVPEDSLIPLTRTDESKLCSLLKRPYVTGKPDWQREVREETASELT